MYIAPHLWKIFEDLEDPKKMLDLDKKFTLLKPITRTTGF